MSLRLDGVCVDIAGRRIVSGIDLTVGDGQFVGLLGPNGSGKSTILRAIYRVHRPSRGRVLVDARTSALKPRQPRGGSRSWPRSRSASSTSRSGKS